MSASKSILERYTARDGEKAGNGSPSEVDGADDFGAFGWLRGIQSRAVMLELRKKDGNILAVGYSYLDHAEFDPSEGITLSVAGRKIQLKGRNLNGEARPTIRLFEGIARHRVPWVCEAAAPECMKAGADVTIIEDIRW